MIEVAIAVNSDGTERGDRIRIGAMVALRVMLGASRLAQHVKRIEIALPGKIAAVSDGLIDAAAEHEMLAHFPHCRRYGGADHGFAEPPDHRAQRSLDAILAVVEH